MKAWIKARLAAAGYELKKIPRIPPGSDTRGIGGLTAFFEDIRARRFSPLRAVDCGANRGRWALEFLGVFPECRLLMIEPQAEMRDHLDKVANAYPQARVHIGAVAGRNERALFSKWDNPTGSTFLDARDEKALAAGRQVVMEVKTLPAILEETSFGFPEVVKMDIQGMELAVLQGMEGDLDRVEIFILECNLFPFLPGQPQAHEILEFLSRRGFFIYDICGFGRRPADGALSHVDFVFANDRGFLRKYKGW